MPKTTTTGDATMPRRQCIRRGLIVLAAEAAVLIAVTWVLTAWDLDRRISSLFYRADTGWYLANSPPWTWCYQYGTIPGIVLTLAALIGWGATWMRPRLSAWRPLMAIVLLTSLIGSGVIVNAVLKQYWGRPRPDQVQDFGGLWEYRPVHRPGTPGKGGSFPCGHCTMGYLFVSLVVFHRRSRPLAWGGAATGIALGGLLSVTRVVQGSHFATDTIWSLGIIVLLTSILYYWVFQVPSGIRTRGEPMSPGRRRLLAAGCLLAAAAITAAFMTRRPFYDTYHHSFAIPDSVRDIRVTVNTDPERFTVHYGKQAVASVQVHSHGFGWAYFDHQVSHQSRLSGHTLYLDYRIVARSYFAELDHGIDLYLPMAAKNRVRVSLWTPSHIPPVSRMDKHPS